MDNTTGMCRFCGQVSVVDPAGIFGQDERDRIATEQCLCEGSERARIIRNAKEKLEKLAGEESKDAGYEYAVCRETIDALGEAMAWLVDGYLAELRVVEPGGDVIRITRAIREVNVERVHKVKRKL